MNNKIKEFYLLIIILFIGFLFRFNNLNWDENNHLHPDERFLTMVGNAMVLPNSINEYLDQKVSKLNPNNVGFSFYVYGNLPLTINKYLSVFLKADDYNNYTLLGRQLSAFLDLLVVILVYKITKLLFPDKKNIPYWSALIYASSVLPIQLSHFFAVDSFLNFFMIVSFYFSLKANRGKTVRNIIISSVFFGFALASKVTAIFILPLILFFLLKSNWKRSVFNIGVFGIISYLTLRLANPYYFESVNLFNPSLSMTYVENIKSLKNMTVKNMDNWFPPMVQWLNKNTLVHSIVNNSIFGFGVVNTLVLIIGVFSIKFFDLKKLISKNIQLQVIFLWTLGFFIYQSFQVTPTLRYFIFLYPFFAIFAGKGADKVINSLSNLVKNKNKLTIINITVFIIVLIWPLMFSSIYIRRNSRVEASEWIFKNLPSDSLILSESWDDGLPLQIVNNYGKQFKGEQLPVFDPDTEDKWIRMSNLLNSADYYILTSNRGWGSITTVPSKYPRMSKFYEKLLKNKNPSYKLIKEFTSYPSLKYLGIPIEFPDQWSDEGFTVYDHTKVLVFKNMR